VQKTSGTTNRTGIRQQLRARRNALSAEEQQEAAKQACAHFVNLPFVTQAKTVALYLANDGELNPALIVEHCWAAGKQVYLPVITPEKALRFAPYRPQSRLVNNKYGIAEPLCEADDYKAAADIEVMLVPLVGFDSTGQRIGMGGGFYDRTLADWHHGAHPQLTPVGYAHNCQQVEQLPSAAWDVPLPYIITPAKVWRFRISAV